MILRHDDPEAGCYNIINVDTGEQIHDVLWCDTKKGVYEAIVCNTKGEVVMMLGEMLKKQCSANIRLDKIR